MKKVLILAYDFPPYVSVGGLRPYSWLQHFKKYDLEPIIVTRQWNNEKANSLDYVSASEFNQVIYETAEEGTVIRTPYKPNFANRLFLKYGERKFVFIRKLYSAFFEIMQFFFNTGPKVNLYKSANNYLKENKVAAIIATGEPFVLFNYANKLSQKFNIPWIADYRDPWSQNEVRTKYFPFNILLPFLEKSICSSASVITTASPFFKRQLEELFPDKSIEIIANGFNTEALDGIETIEQNQEELCLAYVGTIYKWHPIERFLSVCNTFILSKKNPKFKINFYGVNNQEELEELIASKFSALKKHVVIFPKIENLELLKYLARNNMLLLFNYYSFVGTKIFDYLALRRKILFCFKNDLVANKLKAQHYNYTEKFSKENNIQEQMLIESNAGIIINDADHLLKVLNEEYESFLLNRKIDCLSKDIDQYSRVHQAKKLSEIIKKIT